MKDFFEKIRVSFSRWMTGRYGADQFGRTIVYTSLALLLLSYVIGWEILYLLSIAGYVWALFRMFSKNTDKRAQENAAYLEKSAKIRTEIRQAKVRFQNRKQYKYFKCPKCGVRLRLTRGVGEKSITCRRCGHSFKIKA